jgi:hypothetical protein
MKTVTCRAGDIARGRPSGVETLSRATVTKRDSNLVRQTGSFCHSAFYADWRHAVKITVK